MKNVKNILIENGLTPEAIDLAINQIENIETLPVTAESMDAINGLSVVLQELVQDTTQFEESLARDIVASACAIMTIVPFVATVYANQQTI